MPSCFHRISVLPLVLGLWLLATGHAWSEPRFGEETLKLQLGGFLSDFDTEVGLTGPAGGDPSFSLEDDLGFDSDYGAFRGELIWRFAPRHRLFVGYYDFSRDSNNTAQRQIEINDPNGGLIVIDAGASINSNFDWSLVPIRYAYSFVKTDDFEFAGSIGAHWADFEFGISGEATVNGSPLAFFAESEAASGPLPVFGLRADYALSSRWVLGGHAEFFSLDFDDYSGDLVDLRAQAEYWFTDNVGAGLAFTWYEINLEYDIGSGFALTADYAYTGPEAYFTVRF
jgi:hypothetical protein